MNLQGDEAIFVKAKEAEGVRSRTVDNYREHIKYHMRYIDRSPFYVDELTADLIRSYILYLMKECVAYAEVEGGNFLTKGLYLIWSICVLER